VNINAERENAEVYWICAVTFFLVPDWAVNFNFHAQPSLGLQGMSEKEKISSELQFCGWKCLDNVRRVWLDWFQLTGPCLVSTVQAAAGGVMVRGKFPWHTLGPLLPIEHCLNTWGHQ